MIAQIYHVRDVLGLAPARWPDPLHPDPEATGIHSRKPLMAEKTAVPTEGVAPSVTEQKMLKKVHEMDPDARVHSPTATGKYYGEVLYADKHYVVQQVGPASYVAHSREQLGELPLDTGKETTRALGKFGGSVVDINYDNAKGAVAIADPERWHERKAREPANEHHASLARSYLGEGVGVYTPPPASLGLSARYEGVVVAVEGNHAIQRINARTALVHDLGDRAQTITAGQRVAVSYEKGALREVEGLAKGRSRTPQSQERSTDKQRKPAVDKTPEQQQRETSFFIARNTVRRTFGNDIKLYDALKVGNDPKFTGRIVAVSAQHVVQRVGSNSFIAHERASLDKDMAIGKFVEVAYAGNRARTQERDVRRDRQQQAPSQERTNQRGQGMSR